MIGFTPLPPTQNPGGEGVGGDVLPRAAAPAAVVAVLPVTAVTSSTGSRGSVSTASSVAIASAALLSSVVKRSIGFHNHGEGPYFTFNSLLPRIDFSNIECHNTYFWVSWG